MQHGNSQQHKYNRRIFYFSLQWNSKHGLHGKERSKICFKSNVIGIKKNEGRSGSPEKGLDLQLKVERQIFCYLPLKCITLNDHIIVSILKIW